MEQTSANPVGIEGIEHAKVLVVGEAWGEAEEKAQLPFQGLAGKVLNGILEEVGLPRSLCRITNVIHARPPNSNFGIYYEKGKPTPELLAAYERLAREIVSCQPNIIVCLGNEAMKAVLGFGGVMDWRGSVLDSKFGIKVIPTIHPAAILREWSFRPAVISDFQKIAKESEYAQRKSTPRETEINPSLETVLAAIAEAKKAQWCAFDIETESNQITCIGLSYQQNRAICIPFWFGSSGSTFSEQEEQSVWVALKELLESDSPKKIAHNGMYELEYLTRTVGIRPKIHFDTMLAFHTLYPELEKSLAFLVSLYTDHPYYKFHRRTDKMDELWIYNATDAMLTYECAMKLLDELKESNQGGFYQEYVHNLIDPLFSMMQRGVLVDVENKKKLKKQYEGDIAALQTKLNEAVGHELNINSHPQMTKWLYDELKLPKKTKKRKDTGKETLAADEEALDELYQKHKLEPLAYVLEMREKGKLLSTYLNMRLDDDQKIRCAYNIAGTETGRLSSSASAFGTGGNLQNVPDGDIRSLFIADEGYKFINADLSQAEARVVAYLAREVRLIDIFDSGGDIHTKNASNIFNKKESEVTPDERYLAKRIIHASNYGMGHRTFAATVNMPESVASRLLAQYHATYPRIRLWHMQTRDKLDKTRTLVTPFGRKRNFFNRWSDSLLKEGLAFVPQSTVADIVNQAIVSLHKRWVDNSDKQLLLQVHDSILVQVKENLVDEVIQEIKDALSIPVEIEGKLLVIPVDFKVGYNWGKALKKYR